MIKSSSVHEIIKRQVLKNVKVTTQVLLIMDSAFLINEDERADFLRFVFHSFGCTYVCLWSYMPLPCNCLAFKDGMYQKETTNNNLFSASSSSSTTSLPKLLFDEYKNSVFFMVETDTRSVPGLVFKNNLSYLELKDSNLRLLASIDLQRKFYQEARIKKAIFMGNNNGVIELGFSNVQTQINVEIEIRNWFRENNQNRVLSSPSSSLRSISMDSAPEYPSFMFNVPTPSSYNPNDHPFKDTPLIVDNQTLRPISTNYTPHQSHPATLALPVINPFPNLKGDIDEAMAKAMLVVISSSNNIPSSSSSPYNNNKKGKQKSTSPFMKYNSALASTPSLIPTKSNNDLRGKKSMTKRVIGYYRSLNLKRIHENNNVQGINRPTETQLHHMISERKRRVKLNESFQALRSFLPHGSKRDKASVLANTREYISTLKAQVSELTQKNQLLETKLLSTCKEATYDDRQEEDGSNERINVSITPTYESTSSERIVNLRVTTRGGDSSNKLDLVFRLLEFLKKVDNVSLLSISAETQISSSSSSSINTIDRVVMRLQIEGNKWDEIAFLEAVKRVVHDITP